MRLPLLQQLSSAGVNSWSADLLAGVITAILLVPQGMAYAMLAGLPAEVGLYASIVPPVVYALFGSSRVLAVGPVAVAALMVANALVSQYGEAATSQQMAGAMILAVETGAFLLLIGLLRLGALVSIISHPVLSGFTSGAAILIVISQLKHLTGIDAPRGEAWHMLSALVEKASSAQSAVLIVGVTAVLWLLLVKTLLPQTLKMLGVSVATATLAVRMAPLLLVVVATAVSALLLESGTVPVVGEIPAGLPSIDFSFFAIEGWRALLPSAVLIALVGYVESVSVAKVLAARRREKIDANQEAVALGLSNLAGGMSGGMPVAGGFSRSVVNFDAGAKTQRAALFTSAIIAVVALFFTHWFTHLPNAVLAAIIVVAVMQLIDIGGAKQVWVYDRADGIALLSTAVAVLLAGIEAGLLLGIGISLALYIRRTSTPHMAVLGNVAGTEHFRNIQRHVVETCDELLIIRIDENLYFANVEAVESYLMNHLSSAGEKKHLLLLMSAVSYIDSSALEMLEHLNEDLAEAGVTLHMAEVKGPVMDRLQETDLGRDLLPNRIYLTAHDAWLALSHRKAVE